MIDITYKEALRRQFRSPDAYIEQIANVLFGLFRVLQCWVTFTIICTSAVAIIIFIAEDLGTYSIAELREGLRMIVTAAGGIAAIACLIVDAGRFQNVFSARAQDQVERIQSIKEKVRSQTDTTERVLLAYSLITEEDVNLRREKAK